MVSKIVLKKESSGGQKIVLVGHTRANATTHEPQSVAKENQEPLRYVTTTSPGVWCACGATNASKCSQLCLYVCIVHV